MVVYTERAQVDKASVTSGGNEIDTDTLDVR